MNRSVAAALLFSLPIFADVVTVSPDKVDWGNVFLGSGSFQPIGLTNGTHKTLTISSVTASGDFSIAINTCPSQVGPGITCAIFILFNPSSAGVRSGVLTVIDDANNSPQKVKLSGVGVTPSLVSIQVFPQTFTLLPGQTYGYTAVGTYDSGNSQGIAEQVTWSVSPPSVATMTPDGRVTAIAPGIATVSATLGSIVGTATLTVAAPPPVTFTSTGSMIAGRNQFSLTTLPDGRVLAAGGYFEFQPPAMPEIYDPETGTFSLTGAMSTTRFSHTATLLTNGKVLIAGGSSTFAVLATAEIYDPVSSTFTLTGSMSSPRYRHTATLLKDGRVLIAGGNDETGPVASAEIFDPNSGTFTPVGSLGQAREEHTATLLADGKVLVTGGHCFCGLNQVTASAEIFNPLTLSFQPTGNMLGSRFEHSAALLPDGKVLIAAGSSNGPDGLRPNGELYDPATGQFSMTGALVTPRVQHTATSLADGRFLLAGGVGPMGNLATAEMYDPGTGQFAAVSGSMSNSREFAAAALLSSGKVLIAGGFDGRVFTAGADLFTPGP